jgi:hypothetical protein
MRTDWIKLPLATSRRLMLDYPHLICTKLHGDSELSIIATDDVRIHVEPAHEGMKEGRYSYNLHPIDNDQYVPNANEIISNLNKIILKNPWVEYDGIDITDWEVVNVKIKKEIIGVVWQSVGTYGYRKKFVDDAIKMGGKIKIFLPQSNVEKSIYYPLFLKSDNGRRAYIMPFKIFA